MDEVRLVEVLNGMRRRIALGDESVGVRLPKRLGNARARKQCGEVVGKYDDGGGNGHGTRRGPTVGATRKREHRLAFEGPRMQCATVCAWELA